MYGIDLNQPIDFFYSSMRYFKEGEHHITRVCSDDVLLLVFDGILRFVEDGTSYEICPGQYHIQKQGSYQQGITASDCPQYLYVHFKGTWSERDAVLAAEGTFSCEHLFGLMEKLDYINHNGHPKVECIGVFYQILISLYQQNRHSGLADQIADYIARNFEKALSLSELSQHFSYSKNHIINLFKKEYQMTHFEYLTRKRVEKAQWMLESTSDTMDSISVQCGFSDYSHLYKAFVAIHHKSPGQWRKERLS